MLEGMLTRSNGISFCYRICDRSSEDLSEDCGHNGTLEWHRGPTHLQTIPCCSPVVNRRGPNPNHHRDSTLDYNRGIFRVARMPSQAHDRPVVCPLRDPFHIHYRLTASRGSLGRSPAPNLRIITAVSAQGACQILDASVKFWTLIDTLAAPGIKFWWRSVHFWKKKSAWRPT